MLCQVPPGSKTRLSILYPGRSLDFPLNIRPAIMCCGLHAFLWPGNSPEHYAASLAHTGLPRFHSGGWHEPVIDLRVHIRLKLKGGKWARTVTAFYEMVRYPRIGALKSSSSENPARELKIKNLVRSKWPPLVWDFFGCGERPIDTWPISLLHKGLWIVAPQRRGGR